MHGLLMMPGCAIIGAVVGALAGLPFSSRLVKIGTFAGVTIGCAIALILGGMNAAYAIGLMAGPTLIGVWGWRKVT